MKDPDTAVARAVQIISLDASDDETFAAAERIDEWLNAADPDHPDQPSDDVYSRRSKALAEAIRTVAGMVPGDPLDNVLSEAERRFRANS